MWGTSGGHPEVSYWNHYTVVCSSLWMCVRCFVMWEELTRTNSSENVWSRCVYYYDEYNWRVNTSEIFEHPFCSYLDSMPYWIYKLNSVSCSCDGWLASILLDYCPVLGIEIYPQIGQQDEHFQNICKCSILKSNIKNLDTLDLKLWVFMLKVYVVSGEVLILGQCFLLSIINGVLVIFIQALRVAFRFRGPEHHTHTHVCSSP